MPSLVNRVPPGLLSLLGIKAGGQNPAILPDTLQPTLELLELYLGGNAVAVAGLTAVANLTGLWGIAQLQPAPGELYLVERVTVSLNANLAAGTTYRVCPAMFNDATGDFRFRVGPEVTATTGERLLSSSEAPFLLPAGYRVGVYVSALTIGTAAQFHVAARYLPLSV